MISAATKILRDAYRALREEAELASDQRAQQRMADYEDELREIEAQ